MSENPKINLGTDYRFYRFTQQREQVNAELSDGFVRKNLSPSWPLNLRNSFAFEAILKLELGRKQHTVKISVNMHTFVEA